MTLLRFRRRRNETGRQFTERANATQPAIQHGTAVPKIYWSLLLLSIFFFTFQKLVTGGDIMAIPQKTQENTTVANVTLNDSVSQTTSVDCGCPRTCDATALSQIHGFPLSCLERIQYLMKRNGTSESTACSEAVHLKACGPECDPLRCHKDDKMDTVVYQNASLCLVGKRYGRNANQILTVANAIRLSPNGIVKILNATWNPWFDSLFDRNKTTSVHLANDPRDTGSDCTVQMTAKELYFQNFQGYKCVERKGPPGCWPSPNPSVRKLYWQESLLHSAKKALNDLASSDQPVVTVHARWLEGKCRKVTRSGLVFCEQQYMFEDWSGACGITQSRVQEMLPQELDGAPIVLLADGEHVKSEKTFAIRDQHDFNVQVAMMLQSTVHVGNPASSIDFIVAQLRGGEGVYPRKCYGYLEEETPV